MRVIVSLAVLFLVCRHSSSSAASVHSYAIIVGNNAPLNNPNLTTLKFADDDAIRYYRFFKRFTENVYLLTVPDTRTQKRYPGIGNEADTPTMDNLNRTIGVIAQHILEDEKRGDKTVLYFAYSGHGDHNENGETYLSFLDRGLTSRDLYETVLRRMPADYQHVFIDACYAEGVVGLRGAFDDEQNGKAVSLTEDEMAAAMGRSADSFPGLGIVVSSSRDTASHEWSKIESGVFTHEVLSALSGAADVNLDGRIEYSELAAFISAANLEVADTRGKIDVIAMPPERNQNVPIVDLATFKRVAFLSGDPSMLGHFSIELGNGEKYLDANLHAMKRTHIAVPTDSNAYLYTYSKEAVLKAVSGRRIELAMLNMTERNINERGNVEDALLEGLFAMGYGKSFYEGFVDSKGFIGVNFNVETLRIDIPETAATRIRDDREFRKPLAIAAVALAGISAIGAATFGALSLSAKSRYDAADSSSDSGNLSKLNKQYQVFGTATWISIGILPVAAAAGIILRPKKSSRHPKTAASKVIGADGLSLKISF